MFVRLALVTTITCACAVTAAAQSNQPSKESIIEQLNRSVKARKIDVEELRNAVKNKIEVEPSQPQVTEGLPHLAKELPTISFEIYFEYNSAALSAQSMPALIKLGQALTDPRLEKFRFLIVGHTDAAGGREYNRKLSGQRAASVRAFLMNAFGLSAGRIPPIGFGSEQLKDPANPLNGVNRRVEIVNLGQ